MTEISKEWCLNMAKQEEGDISAGKLAIDPATPPAICSKCQQSGWDCGCADDDVLFTFPALADNFQKLALSESFERVAKVAEERAAFNAGIEAAAKALEADAKKCDCFAREEIDCHCRAWDDYKLITSERAVEIVRNLANLQCPSPKRI